MNKDNIIVQYFALIFKLKNIYLLDCNASICETYSLQCEF